MFGLDDVSWPLWLGQTMAMTFLVAGFNGYEMHLWREAHRPKTRQTVWYRIATLAVPLIVGWTLLFVGNNEATRNVELFNVGMFILMLPLFDDRLERWEHVARAVCVAIVVTVNHRSALLAPSSLLGALILAGLLAAMFNKPKTFRYTPWLTVATMAIFGGVFWFTVPWQQLGIEMNWTRRLQGIGMYVVMGVYCANYWVWMRERVEKQERMDRLEAYDRLTNEQNYHYSQEDMTKLMAESQKRHQPLTIATLDLDNYGTFNHDYGHLAGNLVLIKVAELLDESLQVFKPQPYIYRSGGEEFNIAFPETDSAHAVDAIRLCLIHVREHNFTVENRAAKLTLSAGVTAVTEADETIDDVFKRADDNLQLSKHRGRDMYTVDGDSEKVAHDQEKLAYFAQPIEHFNSEGFARSCSELLLRAYNARNERWALPERFDIEVTDQIVLIRQVLTSGVGREVTINLTLPQFSDPDYAKALVGFANADYGPEKLTVEITDVPDLATMRRITALYRTANVNVLIDDVGSDNSFELVQKLLPYVDGVKFAIQNLRKNESFDRIKERIIFWVQIAKRYHIDFVLEGVENSAEVAFARGIGIEYFQGYYYGKPALPAA